mmetsp:Transcript_40865/g.106406  ORF Transcript_40865/g.106406 Transcript_40865/m.106406 type:complete len:272 (+) Transcript_40865:53-868(+)
MPSTKAHVLLMSVAPDTLFCVAEAAGIAAARAACAHVRWPNRWPAQGSGSRKVWCAAGLGCPLSLSRMKPPTPCFISRCSAGVRGTILSLCPDLKPPLEGAMLGLRLLPFLGVTSTLSTSIIMRLVAATFAFMVRRRSMLLSWALTSDRRLWTLFTARGLTACLAAYGSSAGSATPSSANSLFRCAAPSGSWRSRALRVNAVGATPAATMSRKTASGVFFEDAPPRSTPVETISHVQVAAVGCSPSARMACMTTSTSSGRPCLASAPASRV